jgi:hypothetical protein
MFERRPEHKPAAQAGHAFRAASVVVDMSRGLASGARRLVDGGVGLAMCGFGLLWGFAGVASTLLGGDAPARLSGLSISAIAAALLYFGSRKLRRALAG